MEWWNDIGGEFSPHPSLYTSGLGRYHHRRRKPHVSELALGAGQRRKLGGVCSTPSREIMGDKVVRDGYELSRVCLYLTMRKTKTSKHLCPCPRRGGGR